MRPGGKIAATLRSEPTNINPGASEFSQKKISEIWKSPLRFRHEVVNIKISQASEDGISMLAPSTCWIFEISFFKKKRN